MTWQRAASLVCLLAILLSGSACSKGSPFSCISSMKSKSTMTWLTITPIKLAMPRKAINPNGVCITERAIREPITP